MKRLTAVLTVLLVGSAMLFATGTTEVAPTEEDVYEYSVYFDTDELFEWWDNENDIVTPYFEEKFGLEVGEQLWRSGQLTNERINTFVASGSFPDVFIAGFSHVPALELLSYDLTDLIKEHMPTYWNEVLTEADQQLKTVNGKVFFVFKKDNVDWTEEALADPYQNGYGLSLQMREDILEELGYEFTPMQEIVETCQAEGRAVTLEDLGITHPDKEVPTWQGVSMPYGTPEEYAEFLAEVQQLGATDLSGNEVYPLTLRWGIQQIGAGAFNWSNGFRWNPETKQADGYLGSPETYDFLRWWWGMYRDGLLDPDYVIQTNTQLEEKVNSGQAAMWFEPNQTNVQRSLLALDESWYVRPMPNPMGENHSYWYPYTPGYFAVHLSKDLPEEIVIRFLEMWDYMYTEEGLLDLIYGPEEAGFRTTRASDGRVVFTDEMQELYDTREKGLEGAPDYYGLQHSSGHRWGTFWSRIAYFSAAPRTTFGLSPNRAFPPEPEPLPRSRRLLSAFAMALTPDFAWAVGEASQATTDYWNSTFKYQDIAEMLNATTVAEFDEAFSEMQRRNESIGRYSEAVEEMTELFNMRGYR